VQVPVEVDRAEAPGLLVPEAFRAVVLDLGGMPGITSFFPSTYLIPLRPSCPGHVV
jgi:hypothetical protein